MAFTASAVEHLMLLAELAILPPIVATFTPNRFQFTHNHRPIREKPPPWSSQPALPRLPGLQEQRFSAGCFPIAGCLKSHLG